MSVLLIFIHVIVCVALILIVLLQTGKGADMGAAFGGGSEGGAGDRAGDEAGLCQAGLGLGGKMIWKGGRNGFDGIVSSVGSRAGFRAPVKRSEKHNCQSAVCLRCLITR